MTRPSRRAMSGLMAAGAVSVLGFCACSGPIALSGAIWTRHDQEFRTLLAGDPTHPKEAWYAWKAKENGVTLAQARSNDEALSTTRNPFRANRDPGAVSRGAVLYRAYCQRCHGQDARGDGPDRLVDHPPADMHAFSKRFAVTLHGGAPRAWFRKINAGYGDEVNYPDGPSSAMPAFGDALAREQIWLVVTYLQSLDVHQRPDPESSPTTL